MNSPECDPFSQGHAKSSVYEAWEEDLIAEKHLPCSSVELPGSPNPPLEEEWVLPSIQ